MSVRNSRITDHNGQKQQDTCLDGNSSDDSNERIYLTPSPLPLPTPKADSSSSSAIGRGNSSGYTVDEAIDKMGYGPFQLILFFCCGLLWMADAMELMILAILSPAVKCQWSLSSVEEAFITSIVFIGFLFGSIFWGFISDNFGRKRAFVAMTSVVLISGVLSALKLTSDDARIPGYPWLLMCRFFVGFGISGAAQSSTYYIEFLPRRTRAICTVCLIGWFAVGTMFGAAVAVGVMGNDKYDWHWYIGLNATPVAFVLITLFFFPESVRVLLSKGKKKEAMKVLKKIEWLNMRSLPSGDLVMPSTNSDTDKTDCDDKESTLDYDDEKQPLIISKENVEKKRGINLFDKDTIKKGFGKFKFLFVKGMWKTTVLLWMLWFGAAWLYYGCVLLTTTMLQEYPRCDNRGLNSSSSLSSFVMKFEENNDSDYSNGTACEDGELDTGDYIKILWAGAAELPGILITIIIIEIVGRKITMMIGFMIALIGYSLLFICTSETILTVFFFIIRASVTGLFQTMYAYTPEVYPTSIRGLGVGVSSSVARVGAILTPYIAQVLFRTSDYATISIYAGTCLILAFVALLLPIETKGKALKE